MEPIERAGRGRRELHQAVEPRHVRQLVQQHGPAPLGRPLAGVRGQHHDGPEESPGHRRAHRRAAQEAHRPRHAGERRGFVEKSEPWTVVDESRPAGEAHEAPMADRAPQDHRAEAGEPEQEQR